MQNAFTPSGATVNISVSAASQNVALGIPANGGLAQVRVTNNGTATAWIAFGETGVTTTLAAGAPVGPGVTEIFTVPSFSTAPFAAVIAAGATGSIYFTPGVGI